MVRRIFLLAVNAAWLSFVIDRLLARVRAGRAREPLRMQVVVNAPIDETWAIVADIPLQPSWMVEMREVRITTPGPTGVGTRGQATVRIAGISVTDPVEVVEFQPPHRFAIRHEGLFTGGGLITLEASADGQATTVRWDETLIPPLFPELCALVQAPILRSIFQGDLARLKRLVETGSPDA